MTWWLSGVSTVHLFLHACQGIAVSVSSSLSLYSLPPPSSTPSLPPSFFLYSLPPSLPPSSSTLSLPPSSSTPSLLPSLFIYPFPPPLRFQVWQYCTLKPAGFHVNLPFKLFVVQLFQCPVGTLWCASLTEWHAVPVTQPQTTTGSEWQYSLLYCLVHCASMVIGCIP